MVQGMVSGTLVKNEPYHVIKHIAKSYNPMLVVPGIPVSRLTGDSEHDTRRRKSKVLDVSLRFPTLIRDMFEYHG